MFTVCNVTLDSVVSDTFRKSGISVNNSFSYNLSYQIADAAKYYTYLVHAHMDYTTSPFYKAKYKCIMKRRGKEHAIIASFICRLREKSGIQPFFTKLICLNLRKTRKMEKLSNKHFLGFAIIKDPPPMIILILS